MVDDAMVHGQPLGHNPHSDSAMAAWNGWSFPLCLDLIGVEDLATRRRNWLMMSIAAVCAMSVSRSSICIEYEHTDVETPAAKNRLININVNNDLILPRVGPAVATSHHSFLMMFGWLRTALSASDHWRLDSKNCTASVASADKKQRAGRHPVTLPVVLLTSDPRL